jgi:hypothetical protein
VLAVDDGVMVSIDELCCIVLVDESRYYSLQRGGGGDLQLLISVCKI